MIEMTEQLSEHVSVSRACQVVGVPRSALYRSRQREGPAEQPAVTSRSSPSRALSEVEKAKVKAVLNSERFQDSAPREVYATLLDEGQYHCSWRTMYRILSKYDEVRERRNQLRHPVYARPELLATGPNQLWTWDITKLRGPVKWSYYYLYAMLDVYSRYMVGWMIAERELAELGKELIAQTCAKQGIQPGELTIHADRGSAMQAKSVALLMADLGVNKSHSRPHVSNDNPYSEAQFKTLKYYPTYPGCFGSLADARQWAHDFFGWYNHEHHHSGLGLLTPADVHYGRAEAVLAQRQTVMQQAYERHPERFVNGLPRLPELPSAVWINPPTTGSEAPFAGHMQVEQHAVTETENEQDTGIRH
jgi:putative transposase